MAHNLHYLVVNATSGKEACEVVLSHISGWGDENNWHSIGGAVSETNEIYVEDDGARWVPHPDDSILNLSSHVQEQATSNPYKDQIEKLHQDLLTLFISPESLTSVQWHILGNYCRHNEARLNAGIREGKPFNILEDSYKEWELDEFGVTNLVQETEEGEQVWIVFLDMHS